ncbi:MAG: hypothetical protein HP057_02965, partial [Erysipelatoclostridium sp.]|nr:hypothetical protein [Thomasclavelia sp.]
YYPGDDPAKPPMMRWRSHASLLYANWLNYFVYQITPYNIEEINGVKVLYVEEQLENAKAKQLTFDFRDQLESGIVVLVSKYEEKCSYFVSVSKDLVGQYKAGNIIKAINEVVDGRGGGKPDFAQGGCAINDNISKIKGALKNIL